MIDKYLTVSQTLWEIGT